MIKNALFAVLGAFTVAGSTMHGQIDLSRIYADTMLITDITNFDDGTCVLELEDYNGFIWECETDADDFFIDDAVSVLMDNMGTKEIWDDEIIDVYYSGWYLEK